MIKKYILLLLAVNCLTFNFSKAQQSILNGYVVDATSHEKLIGATVYDLNSKKGVATNEYGFFSIKVEENYRLQISFVGYAQKVVEGRLLGDSIITIELSQGLQLEEVVVKSDFNETFEEGTSVMNLKPEMMKILPAFFGESDVLKTIQLQPGTQPGREGTSGFSVRGGSNDQNLFLLDGIPVYNVNHLFGFFSVFSPYAINSATYIKGAMPARYGGRLSSVIDLRLKEGNNEKLKGELTAGIIASSIAIDGPIIKDKCSFIFTARRTYLDLLSRPISLLINEQEAGYYFHDFTFKTNYTLNRKNNLYLSFYGGKDKAFMRYREKDEVSVYKSNYSMGWGNKMMALRWNSILGKSLFSNTTLYYSNYQFNNGYAEEMITVKTDSLLQQRELTFFNRVNDLGVKWDLDYYALNNLYLRTGFDAIHHQYLPGASNTINFDESGDLRSELGNEIRNIELTLYAEVDYTPLPRLNFNLGLRGTSSYLSGYQRPILQPRFLVKFLVNDQLSFSGSYDINAQYVHLVSNSSYSAPTDLWLPVMDGIPPQRSSQYTLGGNYQLSKGISFGIDFYKKEFDNLLEFKPSEIIDHTVVSWPDVTLTGIGKAKGMELMVEKNSGTLTGWIAYTLSKSDRVFEEINKGNSYPYRYDRRHNVSLVASYNISAKKQLTASWVYTSGYYLTLNYDSYVINFDGHTQEINNYNERNNFLTPSYHRLDLSYSTSKHKKKGMRTWTFGLYNSYNRINPFSFYYEDVKEIEGDVFSETIGRRLKMSGLFPIIPSVSYRFSF